MATGRASEVGRRLRRAALLQDGAGLTDGQLLGCFLEQRDEAAFAALVKRHGPLVWGVCRRLLNHHDAEDAFQAAFLVLFRKAASIRPREHVANWLYGVARRTALHARRLAARRDARERQVTEMPEPPAAPPDRGPDVQALLDEELSRLPDKYRLVLVLCDLEGRTRKEAARQLGWPEGTVAGRLARARGMLARRLTRQGVALSAGALAVALAQEVASAGAPPAVVASAIKAVGLLTAGQAAAGLISARAAALSEGVLKAMLLTKLKAATAVLLVVASFSGGVGLIYQAQAADQPKVAKPASASPESGQGKPSDRTAGQKAEERHRILRWKIVFDTKNGHEYAKQLEALGARVAIATKEPNRYRLVCDLSKRPVQTTAEDISKSNHIFWMDDDAKSVRLLSKELGLKETPEHIVVLLPRFVEDELLRKELDFAHRPEKDILETTFRFVQTKRGLDIKVASQRAKQSAHE